MTHIQGGDSRVDVTRSPSLGTLTLVLGSRVRPPVANVDFRLNYFVHVFFSNSFSAAKYILVSCHRSLMGILR